MNILKTKIGLGVLAIIIAGTLFIALQSPDTDSTGNVPVPEPVTTSTTYSMSEVASHKNVGSCWTAINGNVYNLTSWINQHPGGAEAILSLCGKDGTEPFTNQHGGQSRPEDELKSLLIGKLK